MSQTDKHQPQVFELLESDLDAVAGGLTEEEFTDLFREYGYQGNGSGGIQD